ncbi:hypothetical protein MMC24_006137 [Lignoscripta atroalba]|nr:hypothetical protein [Lignoscripta atroalba]
MEDAMESPPKFSKRRNLRYETSSFSNHQAPEHFPVFLGSYFRIMDSAVQPAWIAQDENALQSILAAVAGLRRTTFRDGFIGCNSAAVQYSS